MGRALDSRELQAVMFAPLWVYSAVAGAEGPAEASQYRLLTSELDAADARLADSPAAMNAVSTLRANFDARWESYQADGDDPRRGLKRVRGALKRLPEAERTVITEWLLELAARIGASRRVFGEADISGLEAKVINASRAGSASSRRISDHPRTGRPRSSRGTRGTARQPRSPIS